MLLFAILLCVEYEKLSLYLENIIFKYICGKQYLLINSLLLFFAHLGRFILKIKLLLNANGYFLQS